LTDFLIYNGLDVEKPGERANVNFLLIRGDNGKCIGSIPIAIDSPLTFGAPTVNYDSGDHAQLKDAIRLKCVLDENGQEYRETPPKQEVIQELERTVELPNSLIKKLW
jgi:hypothetical protein